MYHRVLGDARLPAVLLQFDEDLARQARRRGCRYCEGRLHSARYRRKVRGGPWALDPEDEIRHSLCCAARSCRRRTTPPSVRFLSRRVYLSAVIVLAAAMMQGPTPWRVSRLGAQLGVSRRTLVRWRQWWLEVFVQTELWRDVQAKLMPPVERAALPRSLLERFSGDPAEQVVALLRLLAPLSTEHAR